MSSYKIQNQIHKKCVHCNLPYLSIYSKCNHCMLYENNVKPSNILKKDIMYNIKNIYVINLEKDKDRLKMFYNNIDLYNISKANRIWKIFKGVDGSKSETIVTELSNLLENIEDKVRVYKHWEKYPGSIGCYLSHIKLWNTILNDDKDIASNEYTLIMEDDSFFTKLGLINLELALNNIKHLKWDILYVGHNKLRGNIKYQDNKAYPLFITPYIFNKNENSKGYNSGFFGYIVRKSSLEKLINIAKTFETPFIDVHFRNKFGVKDTDVLPLFCINNLIRHNYNGVSTRITFDSRK